MAQQPTIRQLAGDYNYVNNVDNYKLYLFDPASPAFYFAECRYAIELDEEKQSPDNQAIEVIKEVFREIISERSYWTETQWLVMNLLLIGKTQMEIATILGVSQPSVAKTVVGNQIGDHKQGGIKNRVLKIFIELAKTNSELHEAMTHLHIPTEPPKEYRFADLGQVWVKEDSTITLYTQACKLFRALQCSSNHRSRIIKALTEGHVIKFFDILISADRKTWIPTHDLMEQRSRKPVKVYVDGVPFSTIAHATRHLFPGDRAAGQQARAFLSKFGIFVTAKNIVMSCKPLSKEESEEAIRQSIARVKEYESR